jgi:hypothetical protein
MDLIIIQELFGIFLKWYYHQVPKDGYTFLAPYTYIWTVLWFRHWGQLGASWPMLICQVWEKLQCCCCYQHVPWLLNAGEAVFRSQERFHFLYSVETFIPDCANLCHYITMFTGVSIRWQDWKMTFIISPFSI